MEKMVHVPDSKSVTSNHFMIDDRWVLVETLSSLLEYLYLRFISTGCKKISRQNIIGIKRVCCSGFILSYILLQQAKTFTTGDKNRNLASNVLSFQLKSTDWCNKFPRETKSYQETLTFISVNFPCAQSMWHIGVWWHYM